MRFYISFFLACATVSLAVPFPGRTHQSGFLAGIASKIVRSDLHLPASDRQSGFNFSPCEDDASCAGDRICVTRTDEGVTPCTIGCVCLPSILNPCISPSDCDSDEVCFSDQSGSFCVDIGLVQNQDGDDEDVIEDDDDDSDDDGDGDFPGVDILPDGFLKPASSGRGLTGDACSSDAECTAPRECIPSPAGPSCLPDSDSVDVCEKDADCVDGEVCVAIEGGIVCVSEAVVNANLPSTEAPPTTTPADSTDAPATTAPTMSDAVGTTAASTTTAGESTTEETTDDISATDVPTPSGTENSGAVGNDDDADADDGSTTEESTEAGSATSLGLTLDPCQDSDSCQGDRSCRSLPDEACSDGGDCRCFPKSLPPQCEDDSACEDGEGCFGARDILNIPFLPDDGVKFCASRAARDDAVCIASHSLDHISREELVFEKDAIAHVLCDLNESCATPGHMVQYKGKGMMMKSYCELTSCVRKVMRVNSPKYRRGLTVPSHTEDLVFTALAARFQSRAEEGVLSTAVRFGF